MDQRGIDAMLAEPSRQPADDVLDLTEQMAEPAQDEAPSFQTIDGQSDVIFTDPPAQPSRAWSRSRRVGRSLRRSPPCTTAR